ncbi:hypothetical protein [Nonomuraea sp. NPDC049709]|uniref:hypothetical protein n=1 Tax=Nonomuraea sp. NPDC049709 TaxID=3154736 RepID=UPI00342073BE
MEPLEERIARLERQVAYLQRHLGIDPAFIDSVSGGPELPPQFYQELRNGKMIKAIKIYREVTGASLLNAKNAVEAMARQL